MGLSTTVTGGEVRLQVKGHFDIGCYDHFNQVISDYLDTAVAIIIDFSQADHLDSSALGMLLLLREKVSDRSVSVALENVNTTLYRVFKVSKFDQLFAINSPARQVS
ncbi:STAS domain-containing protein [Thiomicrospira sp. WB1]|uniref:STAS domain-containing protein n=1 Tax=Thiomicrospira sp. WB1 TaxID=1685380 RepID=UPI000749A83C|nr:STAS domain-containing protein [Thiomicrospira sp. WB1]KUJ72178.1 anti-anti-sigma factor [Thiomicrospira sp. WB1]